MTPQEKLEALAKDIPKGDWVWMPHAGHFICSSWCRFFQNTRVGNVIVSTIGELWFDSTSRRITAEIRNPKWYEANKNLMGNYFDAAYMKKFGFDEVGCDRKYETMVFVAVPSEHPCCPYEIDVSHELDFAGYNDPGEAMNGHLKMCEEWATGAKQGDAVLAVGAKT